RSCHIPKLRRATLLCRRQHWQQLRIFFLHARQSLCLPHHPPQALLVQTVGRGTSRASSHLHPHGNLAAFLAHVLRNRVVGEARQRRAPTLHGDFNIADRCCPPHLLENLST